MAIAIRGPLPKTANLQADMKKDRQNEPQKLFRSGTHSILYSFTAH
jgi:hypothetical protein